MFVGSRVFGAYGSICSSRRFLLAALVNRVLSDKDDVLAHASEHVVDIVHDNASLKDESVEAADLGFLAVGQFPSLRRALATARFCPPGSSQQQPFVVCDAASPPPTSPRAPRRGRLFSQTARR